MPTKKELSEARKAAWREKQEKELAERKAAAAERKAERKRQHALLSKLPQDVNPPAVTENPALPAIPEAEIVEATDDAARVDAGRKKIEQFYNACLDSPDLNVRDKLQAASQFAKVLGLEKQEVKVEISQAEKWVQQVRMAAGSAKMPWQH